MNEKYISDTIKKIREDSKLTQKQFADKYYVTPQAVSKWENGKNLPDINLLKQICSDYNISLDTLLNEKIELDKKKTTKAKYLIITGISLFIILFIFFIIYFIPKHNNFDFKITGSVAYNQDRTSLYISNIEFLEEDNTIYQELSYAVFEDYQYKITKIVAGKKESNLTLKEYLKKLKISVDNYNQSCKVLTKSNLYIELHLQDKDKLTTYTIPLLLEDNC